ncbi:MAG TPA: M1 family aminopeptidase [Steroidobacteraceae bacterium]
MLSQVARFELRYQLRSPLFWITGLIFFGLTLSIVMSDTLRIGWGGYVVRNSPFTIALVSMIMVVFSIFIATSFVSNVVLRDEETGFGPIVRTTRLGKFDYLFGRFLGGFLVSSLVFLSVPLAVLTGTSLPGLDPATLGPLRLDAYLYTYFVLCLPTLFVLGAAFFALATITRSMLTTYVVALVVLMMYLLSSAYLARAELREMIALFDPFGLSAFSHATQHWSPNERNTLLPPPLLQNRAIWVSVAFALLALTWRAFRQDKPSDTKARTRERANQVEQEPARNIPAGGTLSGPLPGARSMGWWPLLALTRFDALTVLRSPAFVVLVGIALLNAITGLWYAGEDSVSITRPVTRIMIQTLSEQFSLIPLIIAAYYAGELVWRDRERRIHEIVDATPAADWAFVVPKIIAIAIVLFTMAIVSVIGALCVQAVKGYTNFELGNYFTWYLLPWLVTMVQLAVLAVFIQMLVPNKYGGLLVTLLVLAAQMAFPRFGWENHLYLYGSTSAVPLSDMNGLGKFAQHAAWFRLYWTAAAAILAVLAYALWRRGAFSPLKSRLKRLPHRLRGPAGWTAASAALVMLVLGGYIYYNTHVLNEWRSALDSQRWAAEYEKTVFGYKSVPQPRITDVKLKIDLYPSEPRVAVQGSYIVENKTDAPLKEVHVTWSRQYESKSFLGTLVTAELKMRKLEVPGASLAREFPGLNYRIYTFDRPLEPGERAEIHFEAVREQRGFRNTNNETRVVENGTFLDNWQITPMLGPNHWMALEDRNQRRKHGLSDELRPPSLEDESARVHHYFRHDSDWVNAELTISGPADQTLLAPGSLVETNVEGGRRISRFRTESPIHNFFSIQSARYAVKEDRWNDVKLAVYYHPPHYYNVDRMLRSMKASLDYYSSHFSPYQFRELRVVEFPAYMNFAQAFPGTIPYSEAAGFILNVEDPNRVDFITYVTAHEVGHQWWAHQVVGADMQGQTVLSETLAQYSALMVMERMYGGAEIRRFLKRSLDSYLRGRASDIVGEVPLERVENQAHIRYQKGGMVMYLIKDLMGEEAVNRALRALIRDYGFKPAPYPTSRDLVSRLRAQAGPEHQELISDLFERITFYDLKVSAAKAARQADGKWRVDIDVEARKLYADEKGAETEAPLEGTFDIGVFTAEPGKKGFTEKNVLHMERQLVRTGRHTFTVTVDEEPKFVGFDPYVKYIDRNVQDNIAPVTSMQGAT